MYKKETCYEQKQQVERNSYRFGWMDGYFDRINNITWFSLVCE